MNSSDKLQFSLRFKNLLNYLENVIRKNIVDYTQVIMYEKTLTKIPSINTKIKVSVKRASLDNIRKICLMRSQNKNSLSKRLDDGHLCFIAERKGDIVGYCWVASRELYVSEIDKKIKFNNAEACLYDVFVFPEYRKKRIYQKMLVEIFRFLRKKGHKKVFINVLSTNIPSQRGAENVGFKSVKIVTFFRLFGFKKYKLFLSMIKICKKCIIPNSFPNITFSNDICSFCKDFKQFTNETINEIKGHGKLREILRSKEADSYNCIVPVSGGKDSSYILFYAVRELGLKPLALFFDSGFASDVSKKNVENMCKKLSVDLIVVKSTNFRRKAVRRALCISKYTNRFWEGICGNCENNLRTAAINEATKRKIPFILWGSTKYEAFIPRKYEKTRRFQEARTFGEKKTGKLLTNYILTYRILFSCRKITDYIKTLMHKLKYDYYIIRDNIDTKAPEGWRKFSPFLEVSFKNKKVRIIYFFDYILYNPFKHIEILNRKLAWKAPLDKEPRMDCKLHCFANYDFLRRTGITLDGFILASLVRKGLLARADAIEKEEIMKKDLTKECQEKLKELGFSYNIIDKELSKSDWKL